MGFDGIKAVQGFKRSPTSMMCKKFVKIAMTRLYRESKNKNEGSYIYADNDKRFRSEEMVNLKDQFDMVWVWGVIGGAIISIIEYEYARWKQRLRYMRDAGIKKILESLENQMKQQTEAIYFG